MRSSLFALLFIAFSVSAAVVNPDFDTGTSGWKFMLDRGAGGLLDWDATLGAPRLGSLRAGNLYIGERRDAWAQCVPLAPGFFTLRAQINSTLQVGNRCEIKIDIVDRRECATGASILAEAVATNTRNDSQFESVQIQSNAPVDTRAAAVFLSHIRVAEAAVGVSDCRFDHIELLGDAVFTSGFEQ